jgi:hypothetical protein
MTENKPVYGDHPVFGDYFVTRSSGRLPWLIKLITRSPVSHAGIYVGGEQIIEARPSGAGYADLAQYMTEETTWSHGAFLPDAPGDADVREKIVKFALEVIGTKYGFLDLIVIGLAQTSLGRKVDPTLAYSKQPWWVRRMSRLDRMICSQLVDECYNRAGVHLFTDGRLHQFVSPGDLLDIIEGDYEHIAP